VARRARHLAFANRHVRDRPFGFHDLQAMTGGAQLRFGGLGELMLRRLRIVDAMTRRAREIPGFVHAAFPARVVAAVVAAEARLVDVGWRDTGESLDVSLGFVVDMRLARTVTGLAAMRGGRRSGIRRLPVSRALEIRRVVSMTDGAGIGAGIPRRQRGRLCGRCRRCRRLLWTFRSGVHQARCGDANPEAHHDADKEAMSM